MFDQDYEDYLQELRDEYESQIGASLREPKITGPSYGEAGKFITKDSGTKAKYNDGMVRDSVEGKPQFALLFPKGIPFAEQLMTRVADLYHRGGVKYGPRNWEKSNTEESLAHHEEALMRHVIKFLLGEDDGEDHAAAVVWNVNAVDLTRKKIQQERTAKIDEALDAVDAMGKRDAEAERLKKTMPERIEELRTLVPEKMLFKHGDELLDKNNDWWQYNNLDGLWWKVSSSGQFQLVALTMAYGPLAIQTGKFAGLTILKDGSFRWG